MLYIASPYSGTVNEQHQRFEAVREYTVKLIRVGHVAFSPIVYAHQIAHDYELGTDAKTWQSFNEDMIRICERMHVLKLEGWRLSKGVTAEIELAQRLGLEIDYISVVHREDY